MKRSSTFTFVFASLLASTAFAETPPLVIAADGPGAGNTSVGFGARMLYIVPMLDVHLVHGLSDALDAEARLSTLGVINFIDLGGRARIYEGQRVTVAARFDATAAVFGGILDNESAGAVALAATPGLIISGSLQNLRLSAVFDVPLFFFGASGGSNIDGGSDFGFTPVFRPQLALETEVDPGVSIFVQTQAYVGAIGVWPMLGAGVTF